MFWSVGRREGSSSPARLPGEDREGFCCHSLYQIHALGIILSLVWLVRPACSYLIGSMDGGGEREGHRKEVPCEGPVTLAVVFSKSVPTPSSKQSLVAMHALPFQ